MMTSIQEMLPNAAKTNSQQIALASVVTHNVLEEFKMMKFSFELFHGSDSEWFVRCDAQTKAALSKDRHIHCTIFTDSTVQKWTTTDPQFLSVVVQKMNSIEDAWNGGDWDAVAFLDADLLITGPLLEHLSAVKGELLLTPHHWSSPRSYCDFMLYGYYNSGFLLTRNRRFHSWWREAFVSDPSRFTDQECLNDASGQFEVVNLGVGANVGNWRNPAGTEGLAFSPIPEDCLFLHVHFFQPDIEPLKMIQRSFNSQRESLFGEGGSNELFTSAQMVQKMFAIHCLEFLRNSPVPEHNVLFREILLRDRLEIYRSFTFSKNWRPTRILEEPFPATGNRYQIGKLSILVPFENPLQVYQSKYPFYDRFLPFLSELCQDGEWLVDVGANVGDTMAALIQNSRAQVLSIEGHPDYFGYLKKNAQELAESTGQRAEAFFALVGTGSYLGELKKVDGSAKLSIASDESCEPVPLDRLIAERSIAPQSIFLLKTDTDGFDADVLLSGASTLKNGSALLFFENQPETKAQLADYSKAYQLLADCGYTHFWIFDNFGNLMLDDVPASVLSSLSGYLDLQNREISPRTMYYFDVLASKPEQAGTASQAIQNYLQFCRTRQ